MWCTFGTHCHYKRDRGGLLNKSDDVDFRKRWRERRFGGRVGGIAHSVSSGRDIFLGDESIEFSGMEDLLEQNWKELSR